MKGGLRDRGKLSLRAFKTPSSTEAFSNITLRVRQKSYPNVLLIGVTETPLLGGTPYLFPLKHLYLTLSTPVTFKEVVMTKGIRSESNPL